MSRVRQNLYWKTLRNCEKFLGGLLSYGDLHNLCTLYILCKGDPIMWATECPSTSKFSDTKWRDYQFKVEYLLAKTFGFYEFEIDPKRKNPDTDAGEQGI